MLLMRIRCGSKFHRRRMSCSK